MPTKSYYTPPPATPVFDKTFAYCEPNDYRVIGFQAHIGNRPVTIGTYYEPLIRLIAAFVTPLGEAGQGTAALNEEQIAMLASRGIEVETDEDDPKRFRSVVPVHIGKFYRYRP